MLLYPYDKNFEFLIIKFINEPFIQLGVLCQPKASHTLPGVRADIIIA